MRERLTEHDLTFLRQLAQDPERVMAGDEISEEYSHDELSGTAGWPQAVFRAKTPRRFRRSCGTPTNTPSR